MCHSGPDPESHSAIKRAVARHSGPDPESLWREILNPVQDDSGWFRMTDIGWGGHKCVIPAIGSGWA